MNDTYEFVKKIDEGKIIYTGCEVDVKSIEWNPHPAFIGVFLKHLVKGELTGNKFSCHLVKVNSGCEIGEHVHEDKWELHEVIGGAGKGFLIDKEIPFEPGVSVVIPEGVKHKVIAGEGGLYLLAKFIPALL